jgi:hypothetical protein
VGLVTSARLHYRKLLVIAALATALAIAVLSYAGRRHGAAACRSQAPSAVGVAAARWIQAAIENVPCGGTGRASYGTKDNLGGEMAALDPIEDPAGGYLGVYDSPFGPSARAKQLDFRVSLARSADLIHWTRVRVLDPDGAVQPTLRPIPGRAGYLLAYEKRSRRKEADHIRIRYYATLGAVMHNRVAAQVDLPIRLSRYNNGTPAFLSIDWRGAIGRSIIQLAFHYETATAHGLPGPDREATGTLRGFRKWQAERDSAVDASLDGHGLEGSHGDRRQFSLDGRLWRVYEAQTRFGDYATWHVLLYDVSSGKLHPLELKTANGHSLSSVGIPTVQVLRAPDRNRLVLVVTVFVFRLGDASAAPGEAPGELVYYQPR